MCNSLWRGAQRAGVPLREGSRDSGRQTEERRWSTRWGEALVLGLFLQLAVVWGGRHCREELRQVELHAVKGVAVDDDLAAMGRVRQGLDQRSHLAPVVCTLAVRLHLLQRRESVPGSGVAMRLLRTGHGQPAGTGSGWSTTLSSIRCHHAFRAPLSAPVVVLYLETQAHFAAKPTAAAHLDSFSKARGDGHAHIEAPEKDVSWLHLQPASMP